MAYFKSNNWIFRKNDPILKYPWADSTVQTFKHMKMVSKIKFGLDLEKSCVSKFAFVKLCSEYVKDVVRLFNILTQTVLICFVPLKRQKIYMPFYILKKIKSINLGCTLGLKKMKTQNRWAHSKSIR